MHIPILSPEHVIVFSSLIYPSFTFEIGLYINFLTKKQTNMVFVFSLPIYILLLMMIYKMYPQYFFVVLPKLRYYLLGIACVPLLLVLEYAVGYFFVYLKYGVKASLGFSVVSIWSEVPWWGLFLSGIITILEELVFRQIWLIFLVNDLNIPLIVAMSISSIIYGLNHITFGEQAIFQKISSGFVYCILYYISGYSILIPLLTHVLQNTTLKILGGVSS